MRNPDPGPERYTSLAWAAVLGHEETFEYLLQMGHDDEELSKVRETNLSSLEDKLIDSCASTLPRTRRITPFSSF